MDALAAELAQLKHKPAGRKELVQQISDLSKLSQTLKKGAQIFRWSLAKFIPTTKRLSMKPRTEPKES